MLCIGKHARELLLWGLCLVVGEGRFFCFSSRCVSNNADNGVVGVSLSDDFGPFDDLWYGVDVGNVSVAMANQLGVEGRI